MTEKGFELKVNQHNQYDIVDWVKSKEKNAICIYNDLGCYPFSSAKALCELLNELHEENKKLESKLKNCEKTKRKRMRRIKHQRAVLEEMGAVNIGYKGQLKQLNHKIKRIKELLNDKTALSKSELMEVLE